MKLKWITASVLRNFKEIVPNHKQLLAEFNNLNIKRRFFQVQKSQRTHEFMKITVRKQCN